MMKMANSLSPVQAQRFRTLCATARAKAELEALKDQLKLLARAAEYFRGAQAKGAALAA